MGPTLTVRQDLSIERGVLADAIPGSVTRETSKIVMDQGKLCYFSEQG